MLKELEVSILPTGKINSSRPSESNDSSQLIPEDCKLITML